MSTQHYRVRVAKDYLSFSAAHFIALADSPCERLHGHNYRVAVEVEAELAPDGLVCDFALLKRIVRQVTDQLDHRVLLPEASEENRIETEGQTLRVRVKDRQWTFPLSDCVLLPIRSTTVELMASWIAERVRAELHKQSGILPTRLCVEIEESPGQSATYELTSDA